MSERPKISGVKRRGVLEIFTIGLSEKSDGVGVRWLCVCFMMCITESYRPSVDHHTVSEYY